MGGAGIPPPLIGVLLRTPTLVGLSSKIIQLFDNLGVVISKDSLLSIPYAISCGWKTPDDCHRIVTQMLEKQSENNE